MYQAIRYKLQKTGQERLIGEHPNPQPYISNGKDDWKIISNYDADEIYVYSAYLDTNKSNHSIIRIVGFTTTFTTQEVYCYLQTENFVIYDILPGFIETTKTFIDAPYSTAAIICPLELATPSPVYVSLSTNFEPIPLDHIVLKIHNNSRQTDHPHKFGVCIQPTYNYDKGLEFIQWIEYNRMMGATFFVMYNMTIGPSVSCIIQSYQEEEDIVLEILPWSIPIQEDELLHNHGQNSQANDCVLRSRGVAQYIAMIDLDEYIVPNSRLAENYEQLLGKIREQVNQPDRIPVQFGFANGIFDKGCDIQENMRKPEEESFNVKDLIIHKYITRRKPLESKTHKFITTPHLVIEPGIHELTDAVKDNFVEIMIGSDLAYLHHYKGDGTYCPVSPRTTDDTAQFYANRLTDLVNIKIRSVNELCGLSL